MNNRRQDFLNNILPSVPQMPNHPAEHYTPQEVAKALYDSHGMTGKACNLLGMSPSTLRRYMNDYPEVMEAYTRGKSDFDDVAEEKLFELVEQGNSNVVMFYNRTKNASRGYREKLEIDLIPYELQQRLQAVCDKRGLNVEQVTQQLIDTLERIEVIEGQAQVRPLSQVESNAPDTSTLQAEGDNPVRNTVSE